MSPSWLWVGDMRLSTTLLLLGFLFVGFLRRDFKAAMLAAVTWLLGWEIAWQFTTELHTSRTLGWNALVLVGWASIVVALQHWTVRPSLPLIVLSLLIGAVWVATGFHVNDHEHLAGFDSLGEALNEGAKTAWGLAYLAPLIRLPAVPVAAPAPATRVSSRRAPARRARARRPGRRRRSSRGSRGGCGRSSPFR